MPKEGIKSTHLDSIRLAISEAKEKGIDLQLDHYERIYTLLDQSYKKVLSRKNTASTSIEEKILFINSIRSKEFHVINGENISKYIHKFYNLEEITIHCNKFSIQFNLSFLEQVFQLKLIRKIRIKDYPLHFLPESISKLIQLKSLDISYNKITELPKSINNLPELESINITGNPISKNTTNNSNNYKIIK